MVTSLIIIIIHEFVTRTMSANTESEAQAVAR